MNTASYNFFSNFANKTRFDIIMCLKQKPMSVLEISKKLNQEQSKISHNLIKLACCHILEVNQEGKQRIYSLNRESVVPVLDIVEKHMKKNCERCNCHGISR